MVTIESINREKLPVHVAVIMDGNGRWAQRKGNSRIFGHQNGVIAVRETVEAASELGIQYLTLFAFSTENWNRPREEVDALMALLLKTIEKELDSLTENNVSLHFIGDKTSLPRLVQKQLTKAIEKTRNNTGLKLVLALSYSGRWEILNAMRKLAQDVKNNTIQPDELFCDHFVQYLTTAELPDPELLIRTSGEYRISNFLLWQIAYSELYFTETLWPDFSKEDFFKAIHNFQSRERRFGLTSEQLIKNE